jgi:hypothetical protein
MSELTIGVPTLEFEEAGTGIALLEKPVTVATGEVRNGDGGVLENFKFAASGFLTYRTRAAGAEVEVWNESAGLWQAEAGVDIDTLPTNAMIYNQGESKPWSGILVAAGAQDNAGFDKFEAATSGYPRYFFRARFVTNDENNPRQGMSTSSEALNFVSLTDAMRAGLQLEPHKEPTDTDEIELYLRNTSLRTVGRVFATIDGSSARIEIANFNSGGDHVCAVILQPDGSIELSPGTSATVIVSGKMQVTGDLRVSRIVTDSGNVYL